MERRSFLQCANLCGAGLLGLGSVMPVEANLQDNASSKKPVGLTIRPYQLLCTVCLLGEEGNEPFKQYEKARQIRDAVQKNPDMPITLVCSAGDLYAYQESGTQEDTPESEVFNRKRDLDVLQILGLAPGCTMPARAIFTTLLKGVSTGESICGYDSVTSTAWKGCPKAESGNYERGFKKGIQALAPPRSEEEMLREKKKSLEALYSASVVTIRPHIVVCSVCQYGGGSRPPFKPDNLPEMLELVLTKKPDLVLKMAFGADWMMCAPCPTRNPELNCCTHVWGNGELDSQLRDLNLLQILGLKYGSEMKARELYRLIFERVTTTNGVPDFCIKYNTQPSVWWDECCGFLYNKPDASYLIGKRELMKRL